MDRLELNWAGFGAGLAAASLALPALSMAGLRGDARLTAFCAVWVLVLPVAGGATGAIHWVGRRPVSEAYGVAPALPVGLLDLARRADAIAVPDAVVVASSVGALAGGFVAAVAASHAYAVDLTAGEAPAAVWRARPSRGRRRLTLAAGVALLASPLAAGALWLAGRLPALPVGSWSSLTVFPISMGLVLALNARRSAEYAAYDAGVRATYSGAIVSKLVPGDRIAGFEITDDALVIRRRGRVPALRLARADVEDLDAVRAALERYGTQKARVPAA